MLRDIEDDGTAGAALLKAALQVLQAKKQCEPLHSTNEAKARKCDIEAEKYCKIADELGLNRQDDPYPAAEEVQAKLKKRDGKANEVRAWSRPRMMKSVSVPGQVTDGAVAARCQ